MNELKRAVELAETAIQAIAPPMPKVRRISRAVMMLALISLLPSLATISAHAQCQYEVTALIQAPPCPWIGPPAISPTGLNDAGHVCGYYNQCEDWEEAFLWLGPGEFITLPRPEGVVSARAYGLNESDFVVGTMQVYVSPGLYRPHAFVFENGQMIDLGIPAGGNYSEGNAINNSNVACGYWGNSVTGPLRAFRWEAGVMNDLVLPLGPNSIAYDISENERITGWMGGSPANSHAFQWEAGVTTDFGVIPGGLSAEGRAIASNGIVAGTGRLPHPGSPSFIRHAFLGNARGMIDLGTLPGFLESYARSMNEAGLVVGYCTNPVPPYGTQPFIAHNGKIEGLTTMLVPGTTVILLRAGGINSDGQIICDTHATSAGSSLALVSPVNSSPADIDVNCVVNVADLLMVINHWGETTSIADINEDGAVNVADLLIVLNNWG